MTSTPTPSHPFSFPVAARYAGMESSPLKDIFALAAKDGVVSFAGGIPDPELFALEDVTAAYDWVLSHHGSRALQYGGQRGRDRAAGAGGATAVPLRADGRLADPHHLRVPGGAVRDRRGAPGAR